MCAVVATLVIVVLVGLGVVVVLEVRITRKVGIAVVVVGNNGLSDWAWW